MSQVKQPDNLSGAGYWRSVEDLAGSEQVRDLVAREFPGYDADSIASGSRRSFLKLMSASMALAGLTLTGCRRWPKETLAPYSSNPVGRIPGVPEQYATAYELGGVAHPLLVTSYDGRPIKVEGNPSHPMTRVANGRYGASTRLAQASVLDVYDPHRRTGVLKKSGTSRRRSSWDEAIDDLSAAIKANPAGFAVLSESSSSPSVAEMRKRLTAANAQLKWYEYEPISDDNALEGGRLAFGTAVRPILHLDQVDVLLCLDADILGEHPAEVRYSADWAARRRAADEGTMSRVYMAESAFSTSGSVADVRIGATPDRVYAIGLAIAAEVGVAGVTAAELSASEKNFVTSAAADLRKAGARAAVAVGCSASPAAHALGYAINSKLGAIGSAITLHADPAGDRPTHVQAIKDLTAAMNAGSVKTLLILGGNPAYDAPADLNFAAALAKVETSAHLAHFDDETSQLCAWHLPRAHYLECWGDARSWDGTATIAQPLIEPLFEGKSVIELLSHVLNEESPAGDVIVKSVWAGTFSTDLAYRTALEQGVIPDTAFAAVSPPMKPVTYPAPAAPAAGTFVVRLNCDQRVYDGRFANNGWMQETPETMSKLVWDNAAMISRKDAEALGIKHGTVIKVETPTGQSLEIAAFVLPGHPSGVLNISLGYGRGEVAGPIGKFLGFNSYSIRTTAAPSVIAGAKVTSLGKVYTLATTQEHHILNSPDDVRATEAEVERIGTRGHSGRIIHEATFAEYSGNHGMFGKPRGVPLQLFPAPYVLRDTHAWGMSVDMNACTGCGSCLVACQAENNIPIVGKTEVLRHREMNWIRLDRYFKAAEGDTTLENVDVVHQPMMCQQCENAPCEQVCPVAATVHDSEGLNTMVYNRCIGTRYCSNNCPYKVRRFNYFDFHSKNPRDTWGTPFLDFPDKQQLEQVDKIHRMVFNPEVTVRMRGVMEKCTYCVQRIHLTTIAKRGQGGDVRDGDILTACQQACPTEALVFGDLNDPESQVSRLHKHQRSYMVLEELNTRARTRYMAKLRNPSEAFAVAAEPSKEA